MPSPAAAALVVGLVWVATDLREARWISSTAPNSAWLAWIVTVYAGLTMVSNVPFYSFKDINFRRTVPFIFLLLLVAGFVLISSDPPMMLFPLFVVYGLSGYVLWGWRHWRGIPSPVVSPRRRHRAAAPGARSGREARRARPDRCNRGRRGDAVPTARLVVLSPGPASTPAGSRSSSVAERIPGPAVGRDDGRGAPGALESSSSPLSKSASSSIIVADRAAIGSDAERPTPEPDANDSGCRTGPTRRSRDSLQALRAAPATGRLSSAGAWPVPAGA